MPDGHEHKSLEIGSESTPDEYIATMVQVFREVRRVLRDDGTVWCNMGDSYANTGNTGQTDFSASSVGYGGRGRGVLGGQPAKQIPRGLKPKDLLMMPARLALALQADGWWLRSDIIWAKPNPMPESVTDRPTSAHEHVFLLTKRSRYFYDGESIRQPVSAGNDGRGINVPLCDSGNRAINGPTQATRVYDTIKGASARNVWTIATAPFPAAHFATFPPELAERCIRAGTSERGCCAQCGKPWVRQSERDTQPQAYAAQKYDVSDPAFRTKRNMGARYQAQLDANPLRTTGWSPGCFCCRICDEQRLSSEHASQRPGSREGLAPSLGQAQASGPSAPGETPSEPEQTSTDLQTLWQSSLPQEGGTVLQHKLRCEMDVGDGTGEPVQAGWDREIQGETRQRKDEIRPPPNDGEASRSAAGDERTRSSSERHQGRQSTREPSGAEARHAHKVSHHAATGHELTPYDTAPCVVLDCFSGAGTALLVADRLGRDAIGIDLSHQYVEMARERLQADCPLFADINDAPVASEEAYDRDMRDLFAEAAE